MSVTKKPQSPTVGRFSLLGIAVLALAGCRAAKQPPAPPPPPAVTVIRPVSHPVKSYYEYNGYLDAVETVQIKARVQGFLNDIKFTDGEEVQKGDLLFNIDPREYEAAVKQAEADRYKAVAELKKARADEIRAKQLLNARGISEEEYQQRVAARETAEAVIKQTDAAVEKAQLQRSFTEIRAPIGGQINRTLVTRGNLVGQGEATLLTTIVRMDPVYVYFDVPERDLVEYQRALRETPMPTPTSREIPVEVGVATEAGYPHVGRIDFRENRVDTGTGTVRIRGSIPNPRVPPGNARLLYPGLYAKVRVPAATGTQNHLVIPEEALMTGQEGRFVYVVGADGIVQKRTVQVGPTVWKAPPPDEQAGPGWALAWSDPEQKGDPGEVKSAVAILKGLRPEDRVIVNGLQRSRPGSPVAPEEAAFRGPPPQ